MAIPLAFSHLVKVTCMRAGNSAKQMECFQTFGSKYVNDFYQKFKAANNRDDKYLYLEALQNMKFGGQATLLKDMIYGKTGDEAEFRAQAIWAAAWEGTYLCFFKAWNFYTFPVAVKIRQYAETIKILDFPNIWLY